MGLTQIRFLWHSPQAFFQRALHASLLQGKPRSYVEFRVLLMCLFVLVRHSAFFHLALARAPAPRSKA
jgi:hypothetical protein